MSEGRNLQFCNLLVNLGLSWNPMRMEQRIGRVHRIGQKRDVFVFNMALKGTVEEYVLERLYHKIDLFQQSVGELSSILSRLEESGTSFEDQIFDRLVNADSEVDLENDFDAMAVDLQEQRELADKLEEFNNGVFEGFDLGKAMTDEALAVTQSVVEDFSERYLESLGGTIETRGDTWEVAIPDNEDTELPAGTLSLLCGTNRDEDSTGEHLHPESEFFQRILREAAERRPTGKISIEAGRDDVVIPQWIKEGDVEVREIQFTPYYDRTAIVVLF